MATKKSKKKLNVVQKIIAFAGACIVLEILFLSFYSTEKPVAVKEAIDRSIQNLPGDQKEKEVKKLLVSLSHYASTHKGQFPHTLSQLIPAYYDKPPIDPSTNKPFVFKIENNVPIIVGNENSGIAPSAQGSTQQADGKAVTPEAEQKKLIATLKDENKEAPFLYDPKGKRDPFRPFDLTPKLENDDPTKTELERYTIGQLKLTAVLDSLEEPRAIVENSQGLGFPVKKGTKIGTEGGEVVEIVKDRILILEQWVDFTGEKKSRTVEMKLRNAAAE